jgi:hypothetical protein
MRFFRINETDSSLPSILLYLAALSFLGGLLGLFVKTRLNNTTSKAEITDDYSHEQKYFHQLQAQEQTIAASLEDSRKRSGEQEIRMNAYRTKIAANAAKIQQYQTQQTIIAETIRKAHAESEQHVIHYRKLAWQTAISEKHDQINTVTGKTYRDVTIKRVNAEGMEIQHSAGYARIAPEHLDEEWQQRFLWREP